MNNWHTQFNQHQLRKELDEINRLIDSASLKTSDPQVIENYERLVSVVKQFSVFILSLDPNLTSLTYLNELAEILSTLRVNLVVFLKDGNVNNLQVANNAADRITLKFPSFTISSTGSALIVAAEDFAKQTSGLLITLEGQAKKFSEQVKNIDLASKTIETKLGQQDQVIQQQKGRLDAAISQFQKQFSDSEADRRKQLEQNEQQHITQFNQFRDEITKQIKSLVDQKQSEVQSVLELFKKQAENAIKELESRKKQAADLVQVTANITVTGDYETLAAHERKSANFWRWVAIVSMLALVVSAILIIEVSISLATFDWKLMAFRYLNAIIFILPAAYAITESARHRKMEQRYRRMQLELASIDPFLESLPKDQRDGLKRTLAEKIFAQPESPEEKPAIGVKQAFGLVEKAVDNLTSRK
jgi:predicted transcriptional regulator